MAKRQLTILLLLVMVTLTGCGLRGGSKGSISFEQIFETRRNNEMQIVRTVELDVDEDGENEWLVLYRYDPYLQRNWDNTPIQGVVYDAVPCDPPTIHSWRLPFYDNDYLGEGRNISASMADWLRSDDPRRATNELIIEGPGSSANTLTIFRFHDYLDDPCRPPDNTRQGFSLLGYFRANGRITWDQEAQTVTTYHRTAYERSQLAIRSVYSPINTPQGQSFIGANGRPVPPGEQSVDFLFGIPASPMDSPYPEKAVAAFYLALGWNNPRAQSFLADNLQGGFPSNTFGLDLPPDQISRVLIHSISYTPDREAERQRLDRQVTMVVVPVNLQNQQLPPRRVTWRLIGVPIREGMEDCEWRLAELIGSSVTDGLGMTPLFDEEIAGLAAIP
jgi:hypothetical protein